MRDRSHMGATRAARSPHSSASFSTERHRARLRYEAVGLGAFTAGLLLLLGAGRHSGVVGPFLHYSLAFLVGRVGAAAVAVALLVLGAATVLRGERIQLGRLAAGFGILLWVLLAIWELRAPAGGLFGRALAEAPGGLLGVVLAEALRPLFGRMFGILLLSMAGLCTLGYLTNTPLVEMFAVAGRATSLLAKELRAALPPLRLPIVIHREPVPPPRSARRRKPPEPPQTEPEPETEDAAEEGESKPTGPPNLRVIELEDEEPKSEGNRPPAEGYENYQLPPTSLLTEVASSEAAERDALASVDILEEALASYGIDAQVADVRRGPRVTRYEIHLPAGVRVSRVTNLADDLAYALSALNVRVEAPVPGKGVIGIEVPNTDVTFVHLREILESEAAGRTHSKIAFALGRGISGQPMMADLATMPHLLIAGATNSGKSVCLNSMITSMLFRARPDEVKMLLIDPKRVELSLFSSIPHLAAPVAHDAREAAGLLRWALREMELRYQQFADLGVRNILGWNERARTDEEVDPLYYLVILIDELADLMMQAATEFETSICRLAQLARATGIHLVVATQRPSVNVITGTIKANIASRIAFAVASQVDSRTILDVNGAERLVGSGDMLYLPLDAVTGKPVRIQGAYVNERDIVQVVDFLKQQATPAYAKGAVESAGSVVIPGKGDDADDPMFKTALEFVLATKHASASMLQRKFKLGYTRAARIIDMMEERGYVGPNDGRKPREVYAHSAERVARLAEESMDEKAEDPEDDGEEERDE